MGQSGSIDTDEHLRWLVERRRLDLNNFENRLIQINTINAIILTILITAYYNKYVFLVEKILLSTFILLIAIQLLVYIFISFPRKIKPEIEKTNTNDNLEKYYAVLKKAVETKAKIVRFCMILFSSGILVILADLMIMIFD